MRESVWTEGKPQSPPQHLSSMAAAMFWFKHGDVTAVISEAARAAVAGVWKNKTTRDIRQNRHTVVLDSMSKSIASNFSFEYR